jgi:hypothetical protein
MSNLKRSSSSVDDFQEKKSLKTIPELDESYWSIFTDEASEISCTQEQSKIEQPLNNTQDSVIYLETTEHVSQPDSFHSFMEKENQVEKPYKYASLISRTTSVQYGLDERPVYEDYSWIQLGRMVRNESDTSSIYPSQPESLALTDWDAPKTFRSQPPFIRKEIKHKDHLVSGYTLVHLHNMFIGPYEHLTSTKNQEVEEKKHENS